MTRTPQRVTFTGSRATPLAGRLDLPAGPPRAFALFAHCFTCSKDILAAGRIAAELNGQGIGVLRFDFTGLGSSDGDFANTDFSSNLDDLRLAAAWLRENHAAPQLLIGHSLGGAAMIAVAADLPEVRAVATIGAPADVAHITQLFSPQLPEIEEQGRAMVDIAGRCFTIRREMLDDLATHSIMERAGTLRAALLVVHAPTDNVVGIDNAAQIFTAARHPKSFLALDGADHLLTRTADAIYAARMIACWSQPYIIDEHPAAPSPQASAPVVVAETGQGTFLNHVVVGDHHFLADEPVDVGGFDAGPSPYDLLGAALGACTSMTLRLYADRKGFPLDRVTVEVSHAKSHAQDCEACVEGAGPLVDRFERRILVAGTLDDDQRAALLRIADKCPVHRTLERTSQISTTIVADT
ncbi:MAG TPA: alpha/beta fold hydrolase [Ilumatobacteraceae bacterium]|nr:alpha/beta fold hydrolase [Ilumatobacteraceae bacterium]HRB04530.1 alpha/beta fold hydrolase [Ilumatobacteraceae bacterium]